MLRFFLFVLFFFFLVDLFTIPDLGVLISGMLRKRKKIEKEIVGLSIVYIPPLCRRDYFHYRELIGYRWWMRAEYHTRDVINRRRCTLFRCAGWKKNVWEWERGLDGKNRRKSYRNNFGKEMIHFFEKITGVRLLSKERNCVTDVWNWRKFS